MKFLKRIATLTAFMMAWLTICASTPADSDTLILSRVFKYAASIDTTTQAPNSYAYKKYFINVERRNIALLPVPTMYRIAHGPRRKYVGETFDEITLKNHHVKRVKHLLSLTTIPHHKEALPTTLKFLTPEIYDQTVIENYLLSPFNKINKFYYKYKYSDLAGSLVIVSFKPKINNTQLVRGSAIVASESGRIVAGYMEGEYDMIMFRLSFTMGPEGLSSLYPVKCTVDSRFSFLGNKTTAHYTAYFGLDCHVPDSINNLESLELMDKVRPEALTQEERDLYYDFYKKSVDDVASKSTKKENQWAKHLFWDVLGDNMLNKITGQYGTEQQGYVRINPLFNPLYMGYSGHKGFYYKFDIRSSYSLSRNSYLYGRIKGGYAFKRKQFYYTIPLEYHFDNKNNGYVKLTVGNGNWIRNEHARKDAEGILPDTAHFRHDKLPYFKDFKLSLLCNYDFTPKFGISAGLIVHHRRAVERNAYKQAHLPSFYRSAGPTIELNIRPWGWGGPIINAAYEHSLKGFLNSNMSYERWEFDLQYVQHINQLRSISYRGGYGMYTKIKGADYFLDYTNFRDENIPGGWEDEWTGEFELLNRDWYNMSKYYVRTNVTYETPLLLLSWIPRVGHVVEKERLYASALLVTHLHPYVEVGYGMTTRWASVGVFMANRNGKYDGMGVKFEFELFRQW